MVLAFLASVAQFAIPLLKTKLSSLYVSGWYILGSLIFTLFAYPIGNIVPQLLPGAQGAAFSGLWIHDAIGLYVTPLALSMAFFVVPLVTKRPVYSHFLSMLGFWLLFFVYPLNGTHHYVFFRDPNGCSKGSDRSIRLFGHGRDFGCYQFAPFIARLLEAAEGRLVFALHLDGYDSLLDCELAGIDAGAYAVQSPCSL